ncbi:hypothetical protein GX48_06842 [Paracoccidioides brasiliensis]|nr:hypothetical protein GX48_06842 [Paracoccidioides brasiliensis]
MESYLGILSWEVYSADEYDTIEGGRDECCRWEDEAVGGFWRQKLLATLSGFDGCPPLSTAINTQQLQQHRITTTSDDDDDDNRLFKGHVYGGKIPQFLQWVILFLLRAGISP